MFDDAGRTSTFALAFRRTGETSVRDNGRKRPRIHENDPCRHHSEKLSNRPVQNASSEYSEV
jgi:hypothetical protein